ncbi:MAG: DUF192 domain-containing protein [Oligoflexia bacterium]|nr:DUF192 domain-containing protein [Oligoflexia bacterium]
MTITPLKEFATKKIQIKRKDGAVLFSKALATESAAERMKGLLGKKNLNSDEALLIKPCNSVHTFFMSMPIDVAFLDSKNKIVAIYREMKPWRLSWIHFFATSVIEAKSGRFSECNLSLGEELEICQFS